MTRSFIILKLEFSGIFLAFFTFSSAFLQLCIPLTYAGERGIDGKEEERSQIHAMALCMCGGEGGPGHFPRDLQPSTAWSCSCKSCGERRGIGSFSLFFSILSSGISPYLSAPEQAHGNNLQTLLLRNPATAARCLLSVSL